MQLQIEENIRDINKCADSILQKCNTNNFIIECKMKYFEAINVYYIQLKNRQLFQYYKIY